MEYIWLIIIVAIILKNLGRLTERYGSRGKLDFPREEPPFDADELLLESTADGKPGESEPDPDLTAYPDGRGSLAVVSNVSRYEERQEGPPVRRRPERGRDTDTSREPDDGSCGLELFESGIGQREFIKGMVWSQILGPRGGIQASKRFRFR